MVGADAGREEGDAKGREVRRGHSDGSCASDAAEKKRRRPARAALGYVVRQEGPLRAVLTDGRLRIDNNWSERELRKVVCIRDAALFAGSTEHAENAGAHPTLIASAKLHHLKPREYIRDPNRVLPCWPEDRYLEPLFWTRTRARLDADELAAEIGWITVPAPIPLRRPGVEPPAEDPARALRAERRKPAPTLRRLSCAQESGFMQRLLRWSHGAANAAPWVVP